MGFRLNKPSGASAASPEAMFRDLRNRRVEGLLSQQADMLRKYMEKVKEADVALQMPTGSGKTLVGLLIAEWRRRAFRERAVYLCPTRQLVNQVVEQSRDKYGIHTLAFTGPQKEYSPPARAEYLNAEGLAVTTYNGLFNSNPFFDNAQIIIVDDAHAAENYIADFWSLALEQWNKDHKVLFQAVLAVLKQDLPLTDYARMSGEDDDEGDRLWVNMLPAPTFFARHDELFEVFETHCGPGTELGYKWQAIREHLRACHFYYGRNRFLIRPLITPAERHAPFAGARQRVYMSATLGEGGELERLVGKRKLTKIPAPEGWEKQGIGRRLFFFPMRSLKDDECEGLVTQMIGKAGRALVLTPSERDAEGFRELVKSKLPAHALFGARDIERSKKDFVTTAKAVAVVANRYDGIDLVGDECRLLVASGLPRATNLQEQFLISRMGASILYNDRIRTRIVQAIGRCTRSSTDYAAVVVLGEQLNKFLLQPDTRQYLHPELQAEIEFGIDESKDREAGDFLENLNVFLDHGEDWRQVDEYIVGKRDALTQTPLPCVESFLRAVPHEVAYQYALWNEDYPAALAEARQVLTAIEEPEELRGYRAFWLYLAGNAAWLAHQSGVAQMDAQARDYYLRASRAAKFVSWMYELARLGLCSAPAGALEDAALNRVIEGLERELEELGTIHDRGFERRVKEIMDGLNQTESKPFENAQVLLGRLLGYHADNREDDSAPDPWWVLSETEGLVFEDYTDCKAGAVISTAKARQAASHPAWLSEREEYRDIQFHVVFLTPAKELGAGARPSAKNCYYFEMSDFVKWAHGALAAIREVRRTFVSSGDLVWRAGAQETYRQARIDPASILARIRQTELSALPESKRK